MQTKLHLGCGAIIIPGWRNFDLEPGPGGFRRDLTQRFPEADDSVDVIFHEHFLEHLTRDQGLQFLRECWRVLRSGGIMRIVTPDLEQLVRDYKYGELTRFKSVWQPKTPAQMLNEGMRLWGHQFVYDDPELRLILREAGFVSVRQRLYKESPFPELRDIDQRPHNGELIVEAYK